MRKEGSGRIINTVSTSVKQPIDGLILSNATRLAVVGLAKSLSLELAPDNITFNNVCPGRFLTDRLRQGHTLKEQMAQGKSEAEVIRSIAQDIPMGRTGKPEEMGALVAFLISEHAGYMTGTTIQVDGGSVRAVLSCLISTSPFRLDFSRDHGSLPFHPIHRESHLEAPGSSVDTSPVRTAPAHHTLVTSQDF
jgi:Enoyl-(Acyl carrier protein) reductase